MQAFDTAMIMTAGLGTRMAPLTDEVPKPMIEVAGKPIVDHVLDRLVAGGIKRVVANLHYKHRQMRDHLQRRADVEIVFSDETDELLETGGGIKKALPLIDREEFLVANTDAFWIEGAGSNLARLKQAWRPQIMDSLILCAPTVNAIGGISRGDFTMRPDGRLARRGRLPVAPFMMAGIYLIKSELFHDTPEGAFSTNLLWDRALAADRLYGTRLEGIWLHASRPRDLDDMERALSEL
ncbi:MAG: nucleotidyltransferase family protein [Alphaproteobacteria bacterium]|nr:MAG: nucleotidyltransferase family protein [Alphaproteobacteria bacterium]